MAQLLEEVNPTENSECGRTSILIRPDRFYVYQIQNNLDKKIYIGKSHYPLHRWRGHIIAAKKGVDNLLYRAMRKHGANNFIFTLLSCHFTDHAALFAEVKTILKKGTLAPNGYNLTTGGEGLVKGRLASSVTITNMRLAQMKLEKETGHCAKLGRSLKGKPKSAETRRKLSEYNKKNPSRGFLGKLHSKKIKEKLSISGRGKNKGHTPWNKGVKLSKKIREKISLGNRRSWKTTRNPNFSGFVLKRDSYDYLYKRGN